MMKKILCVLAALLLITAALAGCKSGGSTPADAGGKPVIVTTVFPLYDWTRSLLGDAAEKCDLSMLMDSGVDLHSFQPTAADIMKITTCDMFIYVGGESDAWVEDVLAQAVNKDIVCVNLLETLGERAREEEDKEGMEPHEEEHEEEEEEGPEYDEHIWLSLKNAAFLCEALSEKLKVLLPDDAGTVAAASEAYAGQIHALDGEYEAAVNAAEIKTLLFGDRFPFLYLTKDYGLDYFAAFRGCSAESEASFKTVAFLADKVDELGLKAVMQIETADGSIANTIINNTETKDQKVLTLNSLQSITSQDVGSGVTYLGVMQENLNVLKEALR